jgi:uncharacterized membrane protein
MNALITTAHTTNIALHVLIGATGILIGLLVLFSTKGDAIHRQRGRWFLWAVGGVIVTAVLGLTLFRYMPVFAVLTVAVGYQTYSGLRAIRNKARGPQAVDALTTAVATVLLVVVAYTLFLAPSGQAGAPSFALKMAAVSGGVILLTYDIVRWAFPRRWHATLWQYEHTYKMIASLSGLVSAVSGNVIRVGQPWSQLLPILFFVGVIAVEFWKIARKNRAINSA